MVRATNATARHRRHKKLYEKTKGFRGERKNIYRIARNAAFKAGQHAFTARRGRRRLMKRLWIIRINAAARGLGLPYNQFIRGLVKAGVGLDRRQLAELAIHAPDSFKSLVAAAKKALGSS